MPLARLGGCAFNTEQIAAVIDMDAITDCADDYPILQATLGRPDDDAKLRARYPIVLVLTSGERIGLGGDEARAVRAWVGKMSPMTAFVAPRIAIPGAVGGLEGAGLVDREAGADE